MELLSYVALESKWIPNSYQDRRGVIVDKLSSELTVLYMLDTRQIEVIQTKALTVVGNPTLGALILKRGQALQALRT